MADKHAYVQGPGAVAQVVTPFRKAFPPKGDASTLKKLGIAPNNESYVLNVVRFLGSIDQEGNRTPEATKTFRLYDDAECAKALSELVSKACSAPFELHGDDTWGLDTATLISFFFFRTHDETTAVVGKLQACTFKMLAAFGGHGEIPVPNVSAAKAKPQSQELGAKTGPPAAPAPLGDCTACCVAERRGRCQLFVDLLRSLSLRCRARTGRGDQDVPCNTRPRRRPGSSRRPAPWVAMPTECRQWTRPYRMYRGPYRETRVCTRSLQEVPLRGGRTLVARTIA